MQQRKITITVSITAQIGLSFMIYNDGQRRERAKIRSLNVIIRRKLSRPET